jgi:glutaconyl-CoA/methylmalonyl-CoA decarboxylase subunit gamma
MRRYRLGVGDREFVVDVQELAADRFDVVVGEQRYEVTLAGDEELAAPIITPSLPAPGSDAATASPPRAATTVAARQRAQPTAAGAAAARPANAGDGSGTAALGAPMPGVILELHVKAGDTVQRGQQIAVLDAMKMHNVIGAPRAGTIVEVCVVAGQSVGHGDAIVRFAEG